MAKQLAETDDRETLRALLAMLDQSEPGTDADHARSQVAEKAVLACLRELDRLDAEHARPIDLVKEIRGSGGSEIPGPLKAKPKVLFKGLPKDRRLLAEREIDPWPRSGAAPLMTEVLEIITGHDRGTDAEEATRGHCPPEAGQDVAIAQIEGAEALKGNQCLNFLYKSGLTEIFADDPELVDEVKDEYWKGVKERKKKTSYSAKTLARLASEARRKDQFGPVTMLEWTVRDGGHHTPSAGDVGRLSNGQDGWCFFFCSVISYHTFVIAVEKDGGSKIFHKIENANHEELSKADINYYFDDYENDETANSRIWQAYLNAVE